MVYRDEERGFKVSLAPCKEIASKKWTVQALTEQPVGMWEPNYNRVLWRQAGTIHVFVQQVEQAEAEGMTDAAATQVNVLQREPEARQSR